jgi:hypothetical protein
MESKTTWIPSCRSSRRSASKPILAAIWPSERVRSLAQALRRASDGSPEHKVCSNGAALPHRRERGRLATSLRFVHPDCDHKHRTASANLLASCSNPQSSFPQNGRLMQRHERRSKVLAKLTNARCELEDALKLSIPVARYDLVVMPEPLRSKLSSMIDNLNSVLREIEGSQ